MSFGLLEMMAKSAVKRCSISDRKGETGRRGQMRENKNGDV
jgi:hypothetical protein